MSVPGHPDPAALAREAARWFACMRGPNGAARQAEFEAWLARGPEHLVAYNRAGEVFALGKLLADAPVDAPARHGARWRGPLAAAMTCLLAVGLWFGTRGPDRPPSATQAASAPARRLLVTEAGEERLARLADGSSARLAGDSRLAVVFGHARRILVLERGSARFDVQHETRPFIVLAGGGSVTARGTLFDVTLTRPGQVQVRLIRGVIDVQLPQPQAGVTAPVRRLVAGESIAYAMPRAQRPGAPPQVPAPVGDPGDGGSNARSFASVPVATLVADANRGTARPIRLADQSLGAVRVSGRLRIDDTETLARRLSGLFGWTVDTRDPKEIVLRP